MGQLELPWKRQENSLCPREEQKILESSGGNEKTKINEPYPLKISVLITRLLALNISKSTAN